MTLTHERRILAASRVLGWSLAALVLIAAAAVGLRVRGSIEQRHTEGRIEARGFINKVIACRRHSPLPHPSWAECERRVRAVR
jgi:hypothetical protein